MPTDQHQAIILYLSIVLNRFALQIGGVVRTAGLRLRLWVRKYREPDIVLLRNRDSKLRQENFWDGADLAVEVVSQSHEDRERNLVTKRTEYERVGIQEYWIVDPEQKTVTVLSLSGEVYSEGDLFGRGDIVRSLLFRELALPVAEILDAN